MAYNEIDAMEAGHELDALVAEKVMGIKVQWMIDYRNIPQFSIDIAAAWQVIAELNKRGFRVHITVDSDGDCNSVTLEAGDSNCPYNKPYDPSDGHGYTLIEHEPIEVQTAPLAICRAALKAVMK